MSQLTRAARLTGIAYLGLAVFCALGPLLIGPRLYAPADPGATLAHLVQHQTLARTGLALDLAIVLAQALAAVGFWRLFRPVAPLAAGCIAAFGLVNAVALLTATALHATALDLALHPFGDAASGVRQLYLISANLWGVADLFFGLWLIPMGTGVLRSGWMPRPLGQILIGGGIGYLLAAFATYLLPEAPGLASALTLPATVGELWMVGYLLVIGVRRRARPVPDHPDTLLTTA